MLAALDPDAFERLAAERLRHEPPRLSDEIGNPNGDHAIMMKAVPAEIATPKPAAVLLPIVQHEEGPTLLLTQRAAGLRTHSAQIALPGGRMDPHESPVETALREAEEEIGLERRFVRTLGFLDNYLSATGYLVVPVVGLVRPGFSLTLNAHEVTEAFEVPLAFLLDPSNHELHAREWRGAIRQYYAIPFGERYIWGVTAGILRNLYVRLYES
jgi:8-oxo-dGTP pyrophosphatase MutT (NUDIX family)